MAPRLVCAPASPCLARTCSCLNPFVTANRAGAWLVMTGGFAGTDPFADRSAGSRTTRHTATRARHCQTSFGHCFIDQTKVDISSVEIIFPGETIPRTNLSQRVIFDRPLRQVPFGSVIYADLRTLPGVVTFDLFGHEIELLPRVLIVNKQEIPWKSEMMIELSITNKPALPPKPPKEAAR